MGRALEKLVALFAVIVVITLFANHGVLDFSGVDKAKEIAETAAQSEEGQQLIGEVKETSKSVFSQLWDEIKYLLTGKSQDINGNANKDTTLSLLDECSFVNVIDGDTLNVIIDGKEASVRLIGIDTPESVNPDVQKNNQFGEYASEYTKSLLSNVGNLYLEYDTSKEDTYERILAYVWFSNDTSNPESNMLNSILVAKGYAYDKVYMPNCKYSDIFSRLRIDAEKNKTGLWEYNEFADLWK